MPNGPDFGVADHGTIWTFVPLTSAAEDWWSDHIQNGMTLGRARTVEAGCVDAILFALAEEGLRV